jgi:prevent-host-death family protein
MRTFSITEFKADFSRLVYEAAAGDAFIITKAGKPVGRVGPLNHEAQAPIFDQQLDIVPSPRD